MIIYKDIFSGDELFSDTYKMSLVEDGIFYKVTGKTVTRSGDKFDERVFGGNASAEGGEEEASVDPNSVSGIDVVMDNRLTETGFKNKKEYGAYIKGYMKRIIDKLTENGGDVEAFKKAAAPAVKKVMENFKEYGFFMGESNDPDAMHVLVQYEENDTPYLYFFKHGLVEEKV